MFRTVSFTVRFPPAGSTERIADGIEHKAVTEGLLKLGRSLEHAGIGVVVYSDPAEVARVIAADLVDHKAAVGRHRHRLIWACARKFPRLGVSRSFCQLYSTSPSIGARFQMSRYTCVACHGN